MQKASRARLAIYTSAFSHMDTDKDGFLDKKEIAQALLALGQQLE